MDTLDLTTTIPLDQLTPGTTVWAPHTATRKQIRTVEHRPKHWYITYTDGTSRDWPHNRNIRIYL